MSTPAEITAVANALLAAINHEIAIQVPGWEQGMIPQGFRAPLAGELAAIAVKTLDDYRAKEAG